MGAALYFVSCLKFSLLQGCSWKGYSYWLLVTQVTEPLPGRASICFFRENKEEYILLSFKDKFAQCLHRYTLLKKRQRTMHSVKLKTLLASIALAAAGAASAQTQLLNVSYDVAREFYKDYNAAFIAHYKKTKGVDIKVDQSHGGSSAQARAVNDGLAADVVTFNTTTDVDFLAQNGVVAKDWNKKFAHDASPTTSTMLFLVRNGNPKNIKDWSDLTRPDVKVVVVNPKTGGNGRYAYLAAWGSVREKGGTDAQAAEFVQKLYKNVPVLGKGGRDATSIFLQRNIGDVLITFESEVVSVDREFGKGKVDAVYPSVSIVAENPVAVVERTVAKKGTTQLATDYLQYLYSDEAQEIAAKHAIRPRSEAILKKHADQFKPIKQFTVAKYFGSLTEAQKVHFNDGGQFDKLYK